MARIHVNMEFPSRDKQVRMPNMKCKSLSAGGKYLPPNLLCPQLLLLKLFQKLPPFFNRNSLML